MFTARRAAAVLVALAAPVILSGCGGDDLAKVTYQRTTVPPQPGSGGAGPVPQGQVDVPELAVDKLRLVDACQLLTGEAVTQLGKPDKPLPPYQETCMVDVRDPADKQVKLNLRLDQRVFQPREQAAGGLDGLPLFEQRDGDKCSDTVLTDESAKMGIGLDVTYEQGEPCGTARRVLAKIIQRLKTDPPRIDVPPNSLRQVDPCSVLPKQEVADLLGADAAASQDSLHGCSAQATDPTKGSVVVEFRFSGPPVEAGKWKRITISGSVRGVQKYLTPSIERCEVEWEHKKYSGPLARDGETVRVEFANYLGDGTAPDACRKARQVAKQVLSELSG